MKKEEVQTWRNPLWGGHSLTSCSGQALEASGLLHLLWPTSPPFCDSISFLACSRMLLMASSRAGLWRADSWGDTAWEERRCLLWGLHVAGQSWAGQGDRLVSSSQGWESESQMVSLCDKLWSTRDFSLK